MSHYKDTDESKIALIAALYDCQAMIQELAQRVVQLEKQSGTGPQVWVTRHWAKPAQDVDGDWTLPKPHGLECSTTEKVGGCAVVETVELPDEDTP
jgi:hypothetical protein